MLLTKIGCISHRYFYYHVKKLEETDKLLQNCLHKKWIKTYFNSIWSELTYAISSTIILFLKVVENYGFSKTMQCPSLTANVSVTNTKFEAL